jgi:hypothetical protein
MRADDPALAGFQAGIEIDLSAVPAPAEKVLFVVVERGPIQP